ncbi:hypothetical protein DVB87_25430, partial [Tsukamurella tyrosinosolvens]
ATELDITVRRLQWMQAELGAMQRPVAAPVLITQAQRPVQAPRPQAQPQAQPRPVPPPPP